MISVEVRDIISYPRLAETESDGGLIRARQTADGMAGGNLARCFHCHEPGATMGGVSRPSLPQADEWLPLAGRKIWLGIRLRRLNYFLPWRISGQML